jgi:hypothetical protein
MASANRSSMDNIVKVAPRLDVVRTNAQAGNGAPDRWQRISKRAYELAQQRGFAPGAELSDWLQAEKEIDSADQQAAPEKQFTR